ncbi:MAG: L,D-transpeptidase [Polyangiaceae bacterium]|nr:L,D-transpeptidase [Polyangiaceae bacterium]
MVSLRRIAAPFTLLCLAACGSKDADTPALSAQAPTGSELDPTTGTPSASASADPDEPPMPASGPLLVDLEGNTHLPSPVAENVPRLAAISMLTDIRTKPNPQAKRLGALRAGAIVEMEPEPKGTAGCPGGWRQIKPAGFVCLGPEATTDLNDPIVKASFRRPDISQTLPYMYGIVMRGGPVYAKIPTADETKAAEPNLKKHLQKWAKDKESGATYGVDLWYKWKPGTTPVAALDALEQKLTDDDIPFFLKDGGRVPNLSGLVKSKEAVKIDQIDRRNGVAFIDSFLHEGRRYNLSTDLRVIPADRFRPIRGSTFHGYLIGKDIDFPFALVRKKGAKKFNWDGKKFVEAGELEWRAAIALTGKQKIVGGKLHYETKDGFWVDDRSAGRVDPAKKMPAWGKNGEKWIDVNITKQVLVAYEGTKAVYATLVSSGEAGLGDPETSKSTKRGIFRIHTKYISITMDSDVVGEEFELRDVPYVQYFENGYALHGAYWHDGFGQPKSHGCINLAPEDARRIFHWTEPQVPAGWHGAARSLTGTVVFVHP